MFTSIIEKSETNKKIYLIKFIEKSLITIIIIKILIINKIKLSLNSCFQGIISFREQFKATKKCKNLNGYKLKKLTLDSRQFFITIMRQFDIF